MAGIDFLTLAQSKRYTKETVAGAGAIAGVPCQIESIEPITGGNRITFLWEDNNGEEHTSVLDVMNGAKGNPGAQGDPGDTGSPGDDGFSPTIEVKTSTDSKYILTITNADGSYDTPNLKGSGGGGSDSTDLQSGMFCEGLDLTPANTHSRIGSCLSCKPKAVSE